MNVFNKYIIYRISCLMNQKVYIGQTIRKLTARYKRDLNNHHNQKLKDDLKKYGANTFIIEEIDSVTDGYEAGELEKWYIKFYKATDNRYGYNISPGIGIQSEETKMKISLATKGRLPANTGKPSSEETKRKISEGNKNKIVSDETKKRISDSHLGNKYSFGIKRSMETRKKQSLSAKGRKMSEETKRKLSEIKKQTNNPLRGKSRSEDIKKKISFSKIGHLVSEETKRKISLKNSGVNHPKYGTHHSVETKQKLSLSKMGAKNPMYGRKLTNEEKKQRSDTMKKIIAEKKIKNLI